MDVGIAILGAFLGSAGIFSFAQYLISRHDNKSTELDNIRQELKQLNDTLEQTMMRVTRNELKDLIWNDADNIDAILSVAEYYFVDLRGNGYMHSIFEKWADQHDVSADWVPSLTKERKKNAKRD